MVVFSMLVGWVGSLVNFTWNMIVVVFSISFIIGVFIGLLILLAYLVMVIREVLSGEEDDKSE